MWASKRGVPSLVVYLIKIIKKTKIKINSLLKVTTILSYLTRISAVFVETILEEVIHN
jgi:hypothetical protein